MLGSGIAKHSFATLVPPVTTGQMMMMNTRNCHW